MPLVVNVNTPGCSMQLEVLQGVKGWNSGCCYLISPNCVQNLDMLLLLVLPLGGIHRLVNHLLVADLLDFLGGEFVTHADGGGLGWVGHG